jgi:short-subunit dehydrogenase
MAARRRVLITGAGSGIGRDTALRLAKRGHTVYATTHSDEQAEALKSIGASGIEAFKLDITSDTDRSRASGLSIDVLVNNAAVGQSGSLVDVPIERVRQTFETNLFATLTLTQMILAGMIERRRGTVIFVSSLVGRVPAPFLMPYSMTKFALSAAAAGLREELAELDCGVRCSVVEPGAYHTGFNQRMAASKYEWMGAQSFFRDRIPALKVRERRLLALLELRSTRSIVRRIVKVTEAEKPRLRYSAPWWQALGVRVIRMAGK